MSAWQETLQRIEESGLYPAHRTVSEGLNRPVCTINGREYLCFSTNNYLGLSHEPSVIAAACQAAHHDGVGPGSSRVIGGTSIFTEALERAIATWTGFEDCVTFPTGYMANQSVFRALLSPLLPDEDRIASVVFPDEFSHGTIVDGCRSSGAKVVPFRHNDLEDLARKLRRYKEIPLKMIVTEGVFCLEGLITDLAGYVSIAKDNDALLMVDDAHGIGIIGPQGGGAARLIENPADIDVYMGCMDKALGGTGGFLCGSQALVKLLRVACRAALLSSALPSMIAGAMLESVRLAIDSEVRRQTVISGADSLRSDLTRLGFQVLGESGHPGVPVLIGEDRLGLRVSEFIWQRGIFLPLMRWPAVARNRSRFRINVTFEHQENHFAKLIEVLRECRECIGFNH